MHLSFYESYVSAGFPTPADEYSDRYIDLNRELIKDFGATFFVYAPDGTVKLI